MPEKTITLRVTLTQHFDIDVNSLNNIDVLNKTVETKIQQLIQNGDGIDYEWHEKEENED